MFIRLAYCALTMAILSQPASALTLEEAWIGALHNDATFLAAVKEKEAGDEQVNIARSGLLPEVSLSYQNAPVNHQRATSSQAKSLYSKASEEVITHNRYRSYSGSVTLTQPLFDYGAWSRYKAGVAQSLMSDERYRNQYSELAVRLVNAWLEVAALTETLNTARARQATYLRQLEQNKRLFIGGEGSRIEILETEARYQTATAELLETEDRLSAARYQLSTIAGIDPVQIQVNALQDSNLLLDNSIDYSLETWRALMLKNSPALAASRYDVTAARHDVEQSRSEFLPRIQLYGSHSFSQSANDNTLNQRYETGSLGVRVNMSLYSGGRSLASTRQAAARYGQKQYELSAQARRYEAELRKNIRLLTRAPARLAAGELAVRAALLQLEGTKKSVKAGLRVNLDVLNAEQQLYAAQDELTTGRYDYLKAKTELLHLCGVLNIDAIKTLSQLFK